VRYIYPTSGLFDPVEVIHEWVYGSCDEIFILKSHSSRRRFVPVSGCSYIVSGIPLAFQENTKIIGHDRLLPNPFTCLS
jgi:hypothetical protein